MKRPFIWKALQIIARIGTTLLFDLKVFGLRHVPQDGGFLLVSNHQSYIDPVLLGVRLTRPLSYMAKSGLFKFAPFEWLIRQLARSRSSRGRPTFAPSRKRSAACRRGTPSRSSRKARVRRTEPSSRSNPASP